MRRVVHGLLLFSAALLLQNACGQGTTPAPKRPIPPPPPPPPPNMPPMFRNRTDPLTTAAPTRDPMDLINRGAIELKLDIEYSLFMTDNERDKFKGTMAATCNHYCATKGKCLIIPGTADADDVSVYKTRALSEMKRTAASFYIINPYDSTSLTMTSEQLMNMITTERKAIEADLGYRLDLDDLGVPTKPADPGPVLEWWAITLISVSGVLILAVVVATVYVLIKGKKSNKSDLMEMYDENRKESFKQMTDYANPQEGDVEANVDIDVTDGDMSDSDDT
ncbi:uncharacterized protein LOC110989587 [Acanthaster planci]|uniref:Uncharacterized protein LOC110989587 n=1 Tax=Acanthaster planci TaxID=133434 RepID=A0A8B7ZWI0_ACAPL|nr:uncharacterized protein LOC110989587 [Acanthaster planci]